MFNDVRYRLNKFVFKSLESQILKTSPAKYKLSDEVVIISMVSHSTVAMYLLAIKSFLKYFGYGTVEAIDDGSLTTSDMDTLRTHVPNIRFSNAKEVDTFDCPSYISWKRLFRAREISEKSYVIQLDSDTVSVGNLVDVHTNVRSNRGFVIGNRKWSQGVDIEFLDAIASQWQEEQVQARAEQGFRDLDFFKDGTKYLRGCAGFAGYPKHFASVEEICALSRSIESYVGEEWKKWGSEQTATLCLISKLPGSVILPWPYYQNYRYPITNENIESMNLVHFIGENRFKDAKYRTLMKSFIKSCV